jgi:hypothetical protein
MRRTSLMVLVLAAVFLTAANSAPALMAQAAAPGAHAKPTHVSRKATPHRAARAIARGKVHSQGCQVPHRVGHRPAHAAPHKRHSSGTPRSEESNQRRRSPRSPGRSSGKTTRPRPTGLERIEDEDDLADRIARKMLVPVPASAALTVNENLPEPPLLPALDGALSQPIWREPMGPSFTGRSRSARRCAPSSTRSV